MADSADTAGVPLDVDGRKPDAAGGGIHAAGSDAAVAVDSFHAAQGLRAVDSPARVLASISSTAQGVRVMDSSGVSHILPVEAGRTLAQTIWLSGELPPPALCSGLGRCGACRVRFLEGTPEPCAADSAVLGAEAVRGGWRLACRHAPAAGMAVELPPPPSEKRKRMDIRPDAGPFRLAVDLGTTSIHWRLLDGTGHEAASGQALNPQMGAGSDVVSRLAAARDQEGRERLRHLVIRFLRRVISDAGVPVAELCIAGNTAMTSILLNKDVAGLCAAPYRLTERGGRTADLPGLPAAWIPPQPAPFVGGDISAGMAALLYGETPEFPFLLADLGTNGEFVLAVDEGRAFIASVPLGPSLEGIGLSYGGVADAGSVSGFRLGPSGLSPVVIGNTEPKRICGTGYLSLLDILLRTGFLDAAGRLAASPVSPLAARLLGTVERGASGWSLPLPGGMALAGADVEEILKVKAAFSLALESLLAASGLESRALARVCLGGALGEHMPETALERLGFVPQGLQARTAAKGNTSLRGAALLLARPELRERLARWSAGCMLVDLAARPDFTALYMRHMVFG